MTSMENISQKEQAPWHRGTRSDERLVKVLELNAKLYADKLTVSGLEHIGEIPPDRKVVLAMSHATDLDIPLAASVLCKYFDIAIVNQSMQQHFFSDPMANLGNRIPGLRHFLPVDYYSISGIKKPSKFNPDNFTAMAKKMDEGKTVLIAVHNPSFKGKLERAGYGATYLADITDAVILPVAVNVRTKKPGEGGMVGHITATILEHPEIDIRIGEPLDPPGIPGMDEFAALFQRRKNHVPLTAEDIRRFDELKKELKERSAQVLEHVSELLERQPGT
jgi:1-acyl-sn-glycerol-3-phosphate acyltransferase